MCFNKETSFVSFLLGTSVGIKLLISHNKPFLGVSILTIAFMQLVEFFLWLFLNNKNVNLLFTFLAWLVLLLQYILMMYFANEENTQSKPLSDTFYVFLGLLCLFHLYYGIVNRNPTIKNNKTCRLQWGFFNNTSNWYSLLVLLVYMYSFMITKNYDLLLLYGISIVLSLLFCWYKGDTQFSFTSLWCFLVNLMSVWIILFRFPNEEIEDSLIK